MSVSLLLALERPLPQGAFECEAAKETHTANPQTKNLDFIGFDSIILLFRIGGFPLNEFDSQKI